MSPKHAAAQQYAAKAQSARAISTAPATAQPRSYNACVPASYFNADLHCHSTCSDGTLDPASLAALAAQGGVDLWALTDHDDISGQAAAQDAACERGMAYLTGVEISASYANHTIHIVGLGFDAESAPLQQGLAAMRHSRAPRAQEMGRQLEQAGIAGAYEGALRYAGNPALIARTHFARFLIENGHCASMGEVFHRYLVEGKPGFVPQRWASVQEAVQWIVQAGGVAVIAHPARYHLGDTLEHALITHFKECGGQGIEVVCGGHTAAEAQRYAQCARHIGLYASRGSDFHSPAESKIFPGQLAAAPHQLPAVWELLEHRIQPAPTVS